MMMELPIELFQIIFEYVYYDSINVLTCGNVDSDKLHDIYFLREIKQTRPFEIYKHNKRILDLSLVCKKFLELNSTFGYQHLIFPNDVPTDFVTKYRMSCVIAPYDVKLRCKDVISWYFVRVLILDRNTKLESESFAYMNNLRIIKIYSNKKLSHKSFIPLSDLEYLFLYEHDSTITPDAIRKTCPQIKNILLDRLNIKLSVCPFTLEWVKIEINF